MIVGALRGLMVSCLVVVAVSVLTEASFVYHRVVNLLLPSVELGTSALEGTSFLVVGDKITGLPLLTHFEWIIIEEMWLATEILPIVRVNTLAFVVVGVEGAPLGLEVEHVELLGAGHFVDERGLDVLVGVGEGAVLLVHAIFSALRAELLLILIDVVKTLNFVVGQLAIKLLAALSLARVRSVVVLGVAPSAVKNSVEEGTLLWVMCFLDLAWFNFEKFEVEVLAAVPVNK